MTQFIELFYSWKNTMKTFYIIILRKRKMELKCQSNKKSNLGWLSYIDISILL